MSEPQWEEVNSPRGTFIGWGKVGQFVTGRVISYGDTDGTDQQGNICPQIVIELTEPATNYRKDGTEEEQLAAGEFATITCGQANLKSKARSAALEAGHLVKITYSGTYAAAKGTGKEFTMQVARTKAPAGVAADSIV